MPVPMPDMPMPPSFDSDNPIYRYRCLDTENQWVVRPIMNPNGWDRDCGYDGLNAEKMFVISNSFPVSISGQINKDKQEANNKYTIGMRCFFEAWGGQSYVGWI